MGENLVDCEVGRQLGCATFCCRLIVRLSESERHSGRYGPAQKNCLDKSLDDGLCVHLDRDTHRCGIWETRPSICREYTCNGDPMLEAAIRHGVKNIVQLSKDAQSYRSRGGATVAVPVGACGRTADIDL